jgi:DNA (cytosine-5)-methyltransferase 1
MGHANGSGRREIDITKQSWNTAATPWADFDIIVCRDTDDRGRNKARRVESRTFPLVARLPGRVGLLRGYGNAIVPQVAAEFIKAFQATKVVS